MAELNFLIANGYVLEYINGLVRRLEGDEEYWILRKEDISPHPKIRYSRIHAFDVENMVTLRLQDFTNEYRQKIISLVFEREVPEYVGDSNLDRVRAAVNKFQRKFEPLELKSLGGDYT